MKGPVTLTKLSLASRDYVPKAKNGSGTVTPIPVQITVTLDPVISSE